MVSAEEPTQETSNSVVPWLGNYSQACLPNGHTHTPWQKHLAYPCLRDTDLSC